LMAARSLLISLGSVTTMQCLYLKKKKKGS